MFIKTPVMINQKALLLLIRKALMVSVVGNKKALVSKKKATVLGKKALVIGNKKASVLGKEKAI